LSQIERDLLFSLKKYQDEKTGMWYQVTDKPEREDNWVESSCTNLFIYSYAKAIRTGVITKDEFGDTLKKAYNGIKERLFLDSDGYLVVDNVCVGTCIESGTYEHYINRDRTQNDLHGAGAFILMCSEMQNYRDFCNE
ncbi:MAG: glycoside hydrolase 105 family protein, partial [Ruminococcaceae bacterium]|nr:glycoside hydrolase 105 family protein [Oscillospiraceae bacterium]